LEDARYLPNCYSSLKWLKVQGMLAAVFFDQVSAKERFVEGLMQINNFSDRSF
jgi:hypothetical protein